MITSVTLIQYCLMIPFCSLGGGASQEREIVVELGEVANRFCGDPVGTEQNIKHGVI